MSKCDLRSCLRVFTVVTLTLILGACSSSGGSKSDAPGGDPWFRAARTGDVATLTGMIQGGKSINHVSPIGVTALMIAARAAHPMAVKWLLANGADAKLLDKDNQSALAYALVGEGEGLKLQQVVDQLLDAGSDPFLVDAIGFQPIQAMIELDMEPSIRKIKLTDKKPCDLVPKIRGQASLALGARRVDREKLAEYFEAQGCW